MRRHHQQGHCFPFVMEVTIGPVTAFPLRRNPAPCKIVQKKNQKKEQQQKKRKRIHSFVNSVSLNQSDKYTATALGLKQEKLPRFKTKWKKNCLAEVMLSRWQMTTRPSGSVCCVFVLEVVGPACSPSSLYFWSF